MNHESRLTLSLIAACVLVCAPAAAQQPPPPSLGPAVKDFLSEWLRGNPEAAAERYIARVSREKAQVLPQGGEPGNRPQATASVQRLSSELRRIREEARAGRQADPTPAPTTTETLGDMMPALRERGIQPQPLEAAQAVAFPVRTWDALTFTGTAGPRHRALFEDPAAIAKQPYWGVITRLRTADDKLVPFLLLWRSEASETQPSSWKLVTLLQILTN